MTALERKRTKTQNIMETGFCVLAWTAMGLYLEIYGPTLIDLKIKLNANYEQVTDGVLGRSIGNIPGSIAAGILVDKLPGYSHLMIALSLVIAGGVTVPVPWLPSVDFLWPLCFVGGIVEATINVGGQRIILDIWKEKSAAPMILLHAGYGIGSLLVPQFSNPFMAVELKPVNNSTTNDSISIGNLTTVVPDSSDTITYIEESRIEYPYLISSIPVVLLSLVFFGYQFRKSMCMVSSTGTTVDLDTAGSKDTVVATQDTPTPRTVREMVDPASCAAGHRWYAIQLWLLLILYFANTNGGERLAAGFTRSYSVDQLGFDKNDASLINTTFWVSFLCGRLFFFGLARWVSIRIIILIETGMVLVVTTLMNIFARDNTLAYWCLVQPLGFFVAPMWPSGVSWSDFHMELTGLGMTVIMLGGSLGGSLHQKLIGYLYENKGPRMFLYQLVGYGALAFTMAIILNVVGAKHGNRFKWHTSREVTMTEIEAETNPEKNRIEPR